ncbi:hypothetical protein Tco_0428604 [Tanacetum coccineum]
MCTYLKNMEGKKLKDLKNKYFDYIQKTFNRAFKRVNTFVDFKTDLVEGSSKRAREELEQESTKKQKVDEDKYTADLQSLMEVIPDEEEVAIDDVPLATKPPTVGSTRPVEDMDLLLWGRFEDNFAIWNDLHAGRKEISPYTTYNYRYAKQEASELRLLSCISAAQELQRKMLINAAKGVNAASEEVNTAELVSTAYLKEFDLLKWDQQRKVEVLRNFNWPSSELITEYGVLPVRVQRVPYARRYRKFRAVALLKGRWLEVYRDYLRQREVK